MEIEKQQEDTCLLFYILDYKVNQNLFSILKIKTENDTIDFKIDSKLFQKNIKSSIQKEFIDLGLCNNQTTLKYKVEIISNQINIFYAFINQEGENIIDFRYKNYSKKKQSKKEIQINFGTQIENLNLHYIDKKKKIGRFILINTSVKFEIKSDNDSINYANNNITYSNWIYSLKEYENEILLTCHSANNDCPKNQLYEKNKSKFNYNLKEYKNSINEILKRKENIVLK